MKKIFFSCLLFSLCIAFSCKKKSDDTPAKSKTELLTAHSWRMTGLTSDPKVDMNGDDVYEADIFSFWDGCKKDNTYSFGTNNVLTIDEGASKCHASDPQSVTTNWSMQNSESVIHFSDKDHSLISVDESTFKFSNPDTINGSAVTLSYTYSK